MDACSARDRSAPDSEGERQYCELCGKMENLLKCARCRSSFYCSKEHQKQHWKKHKLVCKEADKPQVFQQPEEHASRLLLQKNGGESTSTSAQSALGTSPQNPPGDGDGDEDGDRVKELITSTEGSANICDSGQAGARQGVSNNLKRNGQSKPNTQKLATEYIVPCMNKHGMCVVDDFLGEEIGMSILANVLALRKTGRFTDGQLVSQKSDSSTDIRGDKITWIEGKEPGCENISFLMSCMDDVVRHCNGKLGSYKINGRTKTVLRCIGPPAPIHRAHLSFTLPPRCGQPTRHCHLSSEEPPPPHSRPCWACFPSARPGRVRAPHLPSDPKLGPGWL